MRQISWMKGINVTRKLDGWDGCYKDIGLWDGCEKGSWTSGMDVS